ncbi:MAG TPA: GNAT family protein [Dermatophilaceae bacterium]
MTEPFAPVSDPRPDDTPWPQLAWPPRPDVTLTGRWVELRPVDPGREADELFSALDHDAVWTHVAGRPSSSEAYAATLAARVAAGWLPWVVRLRRAHAGIAEGSVIGTTSFLDADVRSARLEVGATAYTPQVWASAVNPDVKLALLTYAFDQLGAGRVQMKTDVRNTRSQRAIARLGATYEGTLRRYHRRADDTVRDTALFSIISEEWPGVRHGLGLRLADWG